MNSFVTSFEGREMIKSLEGLRLTSYVDQVGKITIGYGHVITPQSKVRIESTITPIKAENLFNTDLLVNEAFINEVVKVIITQGQFNALVSLVFNVGNEDLHKSQALKILNDGYYDLAAIELFSEEKGFVFAGGERNKGLINRRKIEWNMWKRFIG
jgi:lysozyme